MIADFGLARSMEPPEIGRVSSNPGSLLCFRLTQSFSLSLGLHKLCRHSLVSTARAPARRTKISLSRRHVGSRVSTLIRPTLDET